MYPKEEKVDGMEVYDIDGQENRKSTGFDALGTSMMTSTDDQRGIWDIDVRAPQQNLLNEMNDGSMFYNDQFPQIPDFPCMSSSSSSSSNPVPAKPISSATTRSSASSASSSTSSAQSWAVLKSEYTTEEEGDGGDREDRLGELRINRKRRSFMGEEINEKVPLMCGTAAVETGVSQPTLETTDGSGTIDCMDVMENFGYMDLIDGNDIWDPSSIFEQDPMDMQQEQGCFTHGNSNRSEVVQESDQEEGGEGKLDELGTMFFDWLKSNKEFISAEDMKNIKLKKSTVECASKRLGSSKEGKKQLLKLILEWVQQHQLQRKNSGGCGELVTTTAPATTTTPTQYPLSHFPSLQTPPTQSQPPPFNCASWVPTSSHDINRGFSQSTFIQPVGPYSQYLCNTDIPSNGMVMVAPPPPPSTFSFMGGEYGSCLNGSNISPYGNRPGSGEYQVLESVPSWNPSQVTMSSSPYNNNNHLSDVGNTFGPQIIMPLVSGGYPDHFPYNPSVNYAGDEQRLGSSATKEARKKRMARQRRTYFQHHHHSRQTQHNHHHHNHHVTNSDHGQTHGMLMDDSKSHGGNWMYWPSPHSTAAVVPLPPPPPPMETPPPQSSRLHQSGDQRQFKPASSDKRQGLKTEKNLKFLLQKVLKQSDVGSLGRIVLPKKEAESHLPDLDSRDGISIAMEDIGTSQVWNMRYRFWPNNKSRMYLLENTGDFVKANGLQEGDFIVLYSDVKCGKYLIRGVKVRQPATGKSESKKPVKRSYRGTSQSVRSSPSSPAKVSGF